MFARHRQVIISVVVLSVLALFYIIFVPPGLSFRFSLACRGTPPPITELKPPVEPPQGAVINIPDPHLEAAIRHGLRELVRDIYRSDLERFMGFVPLPVPITNWERVFELSPRPGRISNLTGLEYAINLEVLWMHGHQIRDISPLANLANLRELKLGANRIRDIGPLANLINLERLWAGANQISDIGPLANLTNLTWLVLNANQISDTSPISNLTNLTSLRLGDNRISEISPLANLANLRELSLGANRVRDISPLANLINLRELRLDGNQISDIGPLLQNEGLGDEPGLDMISLTENPLSTDSINIYIPELQRRGVRVER
ncbi:MAG: Internalin-A [Dehalococcoidia bacterium]|nr:Internalin-A [Bacillota bacterium]